MDTPNTEIKKEPKLRLLNADEPKQIGDIWYRAQWSDTLWTLYDPSLEKPTNHLLCFRRMTPAEEHAEELLDLVAVARVIIQKLWGSAEPDNNWDPKIHRWLETSAKLPSSPP